MYRVEDQISCSASPYGHRNRSTTDMMFVLRRLQELGRKGGVPLFLCFVDIQKAYDSVDRTLLWQVLTRFGVPPQMLVSRWDKSMRAVRGWRMLGVV